MNGGYYFDDYGGKPYISYVAECPTCGTVNVITRTGESYEFIEDDFVCSHCGWYEDLFIEDYVGLYHEDGEKI